MPFLTSGGANRELHRLIALYLKAETDIINEIGRLRTLGLADYHAAAALERVQAILRNLENDCWRYVPRMVEAQFYVNHPEARRPQEEPETPEKHLLAYQNARVLTGEQTDIVQRLVMNLLGQITQADVTALSGLESMLIGRTEPDVFRRVGLERAAEMQAAGRGAYKSLRGFVEQLRREGVTAFVDRAGRRWSLHTYGSMVLRATSRQAEILAVLTENPDHDLYQITRHGTTCPLCAPLEGRVYSRSGLDPDFPPLTAAFGKMDPAGPDDLTNSWLNIHPNCLHQLRRWTPMGRSEEEIRKIKEFSSFEKNPVTRDPRSQKQIDAYREKERSRARWLRDYRQWEKYRETLGDGVPKRFETFQKHKRAGDEKYKGWLAAYRKRDTALFGQSAGRDRPSRPGEPVQIGIVDFSDKKAVLSQLSAAQQETQHLTYEVNRTVTADGKVWQVRGESGAVDLSAIPSSLAGSYSYHNHPAAKTWYSFSAEDVRFFFESGASYAKASDDMYEYTMRRLPETLAVSPEIVYHRFGELYKHDILAMAFAGDLEADIDGFHKTMELLSKELRFEYERTETKAP